MSALFSSSGGRKPSNVDFRIMRKEEQPAFFDFLKRIGWIEVDAPFEIDRDWNHNKIRRTARENAANMDADLLVETQDDKFSSNPFNNFVYYTWRRTHDSLPLPPGFTVPPIPLMQQLVLHREAMKQQQAMAQQRQYMPQAQAAGAGVPGQQPAQPQARPPGQPQPGQPQAPQQQQQPQQPGQPAQPQARPPGQPQPQPQPGQAPAQPPQPQPGAAPPQQPAQPQQPQQAAQPAAPAQPRGPGPHTPKACPKCGRALVEGMTKCPGCGTTF